jgi:hypothetical protein
MEAEASQPDDPEREMERADEANGEGRDDTTSEQSAPTNDTERRYGEDESPA